MNGIFRRIVGAAFISMASLSVSTAIADDRGDRINDRLDHRGEVINERLDRKGERINDRLDRKAEIEAAHGHAGRAARLDAKGDRIEERLDAKGDRIEKKLDRKGDRIEEHYDDHHHHDR